MKTIFTELAKYGVVPVIAIDDADKALDLADALTEGGLPVAEITFRTDAAETVINKIASERPDMLIGAGTVITSDQFKLAKSAGAKYALAPGFDADDVALAHDLDLPFAPGIMTPSELQQAIKMQCKFVKFFPAMASGGPNMLKNISAPYAHLDIGFNPTGGVTLENLGEWMALPAVKAVGGTWIATRDDIANGKWADITAKAKQAVAQVKAIRGV